ncbi:hypothetical protein G6F56_000315 [Rhizopus delemar]|nr:hypothetical protein G6F56_000315 [Rhizopus delemar]
MAQDRLISTPSMEDDPEDDQETQTGQDQISSAYYAQLANPILVAHDPTTEHQVTNAIANQQIMVFDRLAIIRAHEVQKNGLIPESSEYLRMSNKEATHRNCDLQWKGWVLWCHSQQPSLDPIEYKPEKAVEWLVENKKYSSQHLNTMRSAIASVYRVIHEDKPRLAFSRGILSFFASKRRTDTRPPNSFQETYDPKIIIEMIKKWGLTEKMDLQMFQQKTILLITMATMW